jgi:hypothetical protein
MTIEEEKRTKTQLKEMTFNYELDQAVCKVYNYVLRL